MSVDEATVALDQETKDAIDIDRSVGDFRFPERNKFDAGRGLSAKTIDYISDVKEDCYFLFRSFFCKYACKLLTISSDPSSIVSLCKLFEDLLQMYEPEVCFHMN